jgi:tellurite resistance protein
MEQLAGMDVEVFTGVVLSAVAVAYADGMVDTKEQRVMTDAILEITGGHFSYTDIQRIIDAALAEVVSTGVDASIVRAAKRIPDEPTRSVAMIFAAAVAWSARGISKAEDARLEQLAHAFRIGEERYGELIAAGKELAGR